MAHIRKPLGVAMALNTVVFAGETVAGLHANSLSLLVDAAHNFSDELALVALFLAYVVTAHASRRLQRVANVLNSLGLIAVSVVILWQAAERFAHPVAVLGWLPIVVGVLAALGNWAVARVLRPWQASNPAVRMAYLHNMGDVYVSILPVLAGILVTISGQAIFDPVCAGSVALWLIYSTVQELRQSGDELLWPSEARCPHAEHDHAEAQVA